MAASQDGCMSGETVDDFLYYSRIGDAKEVQEILQGLLDDRLSKSQIANIAPQAAENPTEKGKVDSLIAGIFRDVQRANQAHNSPLHYAAANGHLAVLSALIPSCDLDTLLAQNESGNTPLHWAAFNGHLTCVQALVEEIESKVLQSNDKGQSTDGDGDVVIDDGDQKNKTNEADQDAADEREAQRRSAWDVVNKAGRGPMSEAQMNNKEEVVKWLLDRMITAPSTSSSSAAAADADEGKGASVEPAAEIGHENGTAEGVGATANETSRERGPNEELTNGESINGN